VTPLRRVSLRAGDFFFRWRSYLPLLLLPLVLVAISESHYPFGSHRTDLVWEGACVLLALAGFTIRVYTIGVAPPGTSGRNTRAQKATVLSTTGPYSVVRHPLYLANAIIVLGLALFTHAWITPPAVAALTLAYYACIAQREEAYLRERFPVEFEAWARRVPAIWPTRVRWVPAAYPFQLRAVLRREFYGLAVILIAPCFLDILEDLHTTGEFDLDPVWTATAIVGALSFAVLRFLKKRTSVLSRRQPVPAPGPRAAASGQAETGQGSSMGSST
jgi:protein-S-isoprenylcysteine O-methyltransferase Ste14